MLYSAMRHCTVDSPSCAAQLPMRTLYRKTIILSWRGGVCDYIYNTIQLGVGYWHFPDGPDRVTLLPRLCYRSFAAFTECLRAGLAILNDCSGCCSCFFYIAMNTFKKMFQMHTTYCNGAWYTRTKAKTQHLQDTTE